MNERRQQLRELGWKVSYQRIVRVASVMENWEVLSLAIWVTGATAAQQIGEERIVNCPNPTHPVSI